MQSRSARLIAGAILMGAGAIAFALGDLAHAQNMYNGGAGKTIGVIGSIVGLAMMLVRDRTPDA